MLKTLSCLRAVSGFEEPAAAAVIKFAKPFADHIFTDSMGNVYVLKKGSAPKKTIALFAHTDEVGLIISSVTPDGCLKFRTIGGIDSRVLPGKAVWVGEQALSGVIGSRAVHLLTPEERKKTLSAEDLYIDIGAEDMQEALSLAKPGTPVYFEPVWHETESCLFGKAFDDRAGCYVLCSLLKNTYRDDLYFVFTAQEETGLRGAQVASRRIDADEYIIVENTTCLDMPEVPPEKRSTRLGAGPSLTVADGASIPDADICRKLKNLNIPTQLKNAAAGGNDAGAVSRNGKKTAAVSVPCRYLHTPIGVIAKQDLEQTVELIDAYLKGADLC